MMFEPMAYYFANNSLCVDSIGWVHNVAHYFIRTYTYTLTFGRDICTSHHDYIVYKPGIFTAIV